MQSVPITTNVARSNPTLVIQHYVIKFVSELRHVGGFSPSTPVSSRNNTDRHGITRLLLNVALNTIKQANHILNRENI
jgi:hypothetical protein